MNTEQMIKQIDNYINGEDYPDEIPMRIMGLFEREYADLLAEVKRLRDGIKLILSEETPYDLEVFERKLMELIE